MMKLHGWGRYPDSEALLQEPVDKSSIAQLLRDGSADAPTIPRGAGRSYGDSSLSARVISSRFLDNFISFDTDNGELHCAAGVTLDQLLRISVPAGWFLPVVPGTKFVTVGGAIASDIHGKNHHRDGCFSRFVKSVSLLTVSGDVIVCSQDKQKNLFRATCGGMGLTGVILQATLVMQRIESAFLQQQTLMAANLDEIFSLFGEHHNSQYSVAWIDSLAGGDRLGRSVLFLGQWSGDGGLKPDRRATLPAPLSPGPLLNRYSIGAFNSLYYNRHRLGGKTARLHYEKFFFPLDGIRNWNRLYGRRGFLQYQFVVPDESARQAIEAVLKKISAAGQGSFLSVLKKMGPANENFLSFPIEGYTLALDLKMRNGLLPLLDKLDEIVLKHSGRVYLTKDARLSRNSFERSYPDLPKFLAVRNKVDPDGLLGSLQSARLGITPT